MKYKQMDYDVFNEWFYLDEASPSGLRRKKDSPSRNRSHSTRKGCIAGGVVKDKNKVPTAWRVNLFGVSYLVHRIIYLLLYKTIDDQHIDHMDGNPLNNSVNNLRLVSQKTNMQNVRKCLRNTSGVNGVSIREDQQAAIATWRDVYGKSCQKQYGFNKEGRVVAIERAITTRKYIELLLNSVGQNYTKRHGT